MNETMVENWNSVVGPQDNIFLLGDLAFAKPEITVEILKRLNGNIYLIRGNHDYHWNFKILDKYFVWIKDLAEILVPDVDIQGGYRSITLCHYPLLSWNKISYSSWSLHGHTHGNIPYDPKFNRLDVGVDSHNFTPISYLQIKEIFSNTNV
jgi:calcineurin-like phosphoesterase family protein